MRKLFFAAGCLIALVGALSDYGLGADKIRISVTNFNMSFLPSGLAVRRGFFKEEGLEAEVIRMNANVAITALASGDTDYTMIFGSVVRAAIRGLAGESCCESNRWLDPCAGRPAGIQIR